MYDRARVEQRALRQQVAGRVAADVARVRGQVEQLLLAAEDDLDLLDGAAVALEAVVDAAADEPAAELGERPVERRALADRRRGGAGRRRCSAGSSWRLATARLAPAPERDLERARRRAPARPLRRRRRRPGRDQLLDDRGVGAVAEVDERPRRASARSGAPAAQRTTIGRSRRTPAGTSRTTPWLQKRAGRAGRACRRRAAPAPPSSRRRAAVRVAVEEPRRTCRGRPRPRAAAGSRARPRPASSRRLDQRRPRRREAPVAATRPAPSRSSRTAGARRARAVAQVDVGRVELVRLDRAASRSASKAARRSARSQSGSARSAASASSETAVVDGERELGRAAPAAGARSWWRDRHPSDPSISSFTRRLNSMAYSIGSSLVKTSRKPWTMRFGRLVLGQAAAHQVEDLVGADLADGGLVGHRRVVFLDVDVRVRVAAADVVEHQRVAADAGDDVRGARRDLEVAAVGRPAAVLARRTCETIRERVFGREVDRPWRRCPGAGPCRRPRR